MIFEMRTYRLQPGSVPEAEKRFGEALTERVKVSPLGAFFHTEVGPLNRIIHCWPYEDLAHRTKVRSQQIPGWPPKIQEFIEDMESKIINLARQKERHKFVTGGAAEYRKILEQTAQQVGKEDDHDASILLRRALEQIRGEFEEQIGRASCRERVSTIV